MSAADMSEDEPVRPPRDSLWEQDRQVRGRPSQGQGHREGWGTVPPGTVSGQGPLPCPSLLDLAGEGCWHTLPTSQGGAVRPGAGSISAATPGSPSPTSGSLPGSVSVPTVSALSTAAARVTAITAHALHRSPFQALRARRLLESPGSRNPFYRWGGRSPKLSVQRPPPPARSPHNPAQRRAADRGAAELPAPPQAPLMPPIPAERGAARGGPAPGQDHMHRRLGGLQCR